MKRSAHVSMQAPFNSGCIVNHLDCAILGATEIDTDFNVNVLTGSAGGHHGGSGGHSDAAAGAKMTIITANLTSLAHRGDQGPRTHHLHAGRNR